MRIYHEEVFGPVLLVYKFTTEKQAIHLANDTKFALGAAVFSRDYKKAERISKSIRAGMCNVNGLCVCHLFYYT